MTPLNSFDKIAWLYDSLARLFFGDRLMRAQSAFLHYIKPGSHVLILGGGTGAIVSELLERQPDCQITFVDASRAMLRRARQRLGLRSNIEYIHGTEASIPGGQPFTVVITPFYLDMFTEEQLMIIVPQIKSHLSVSAVWLVADFCSKETLWQRVKLAVMYNFFRMTTGIAANTLPDWNKSLKENGWTKWESKSIDRFIEAAIFRC
jgi:ubiquinone/menaquinone biosynthesis C-methylase UbiE